MSERDMPYALFGLFLATRIWILVSCPEEIIISDEGSVGLLHAWLTGVRLVPLSDLYSPFMGGNLVFQVLALPFLQLFGDRILAVKALALVVASLGFVLVHRLARLAGGPRAALFAAFFYALAPLGPAGGSLVGTGDHFFAGLLVLGLALALVRAFDEASPSPARLLLVGLATGLSVWVNYISLLVLPGMGALILLRGRRLRPRAFFAGLLGFGFGLVPLGAGLLLRGAQATLTLYSRSPLDQVSRDPTEIAARVGLLARVALLEGACLLPGTWGRALSLTWVLLLGLGLLALLRRRLREMRGEPGPWPATAVSLVLGLLVLVFSVALSLTRFEVDANWIWGRRYLLFVFPALCVLVGMGAAVCPRMVGRALVVGWALCGLLSLSWPGSLERPLRIGRYPGAHWNLVLSRAIASQSFEDTARTLSRMEALVEPHRSSLLWEFGAQVGVGTSGDVAERVFARELDAPSALHASRGALKARTSKAPVDEEMRDWPRLSSMLLHPADGPRLTAALQGVAPLWRVPRPLLRERLERRPSGHWERPLLAACLGASIHAQGGWAALASAAPNLDAELADSLWFGAARRVSSASSLSIQEILDSARRPPPGAHVGGYLAGLAFSFSERQEVARNPGRWLDEVGARLDGGASLLFSGAVGRASTRLLWRSTHALATVVGEHTDDARREAVCEAMGQGVAGSAKTLTDLLRWRIDWDRFAGPGCDRAFDTGMRDVLAREYLRLPEHYARLARTLDLKEEGDAL